MCKFGLVMVIHKKLLEEGINKQLLIILDVFALLYGDDPVLMRRPEGVMIVAI